MAKKAMTGGMLAIALAFGLVLTGCASVADMLAGRNTLYWDGAAENTAVFITIPTMYETTFDGKPVPRDVGYNVVLGVLPGVHTFSVVQKPDADMPAGTQNLTLEGSYNFEFGTKYEFGTYRVFSPELRTGVVQNGWTQYKDIHLLLGTTDNYTWESVMDGPNSLWWNRDGQH